MFSYITLLWYWNKKDREIDNLRDIETNEQRDREERRKKRGI